MCQKYSLNSQLCWLVFDLEAELEKFGKLALTVLEIWGAVAVTQARPNLPARVHNSSTESLVDRITRLNCGINSPAAGAAVIHSSLTVMRSAVCRGSYLLTALLLSRCYIFAIVAERITMTQWYGLFVATYQWETVQKDRKTVPKKTWPKKKDIKSSLS